MNAQEARDMLNEMGTAGDTPFPGDDTDGQEKIIHIYPVAGGGIFFTKTPLEDGAPPQTIDREEEAPTTLPTAPRRPPYVLNFLIVLILFTTLDNAAALFAFFTPAITITITPVVKTISTTAIVNVGDGADIHGRVLAPLTLSQQQTVKATGRGHQDATRAAGAVTFYNAAFVAQTIPAGSIFTGRDGIQIATSQQVTVPANNPPQDGIATITAYALHSGQQGNVAALTVNGMASSSLFVKNLTAFTGGRDARDFTYVSKADIQGIVSTLTPVLMQSQRAALTAQLTAQESLVSPSCTPTYTASHDPGSQAQQVTVTVSETCHSLAYDTKALERVGNRIVTPRAASLLHFSQVGTLHLAILSQTMSAERATIKVQLVSTWVYQLDTGHLQSLIAGKPRRSALHLLAEAPGVQRVSITGVSDNQALPTDPAHIRISIFYFVS